MRDTLTPSHKHVSHTGWQYAFICEVKRLIILWQTAFLCFLHLNLHWDHNNILTNRFNALNIWKMQMNRVHDILIHRRPWNMALLVEKLLFNFLQQTSLLLHELNGTTTVASCVTAYAKSFPMHMHAQNPTWHQWVQRIDSSLLIFTEKTNCSILNCCSGVDLLTVSLM